MGKFFAFFAIIAASFAVLFYLGYKVELDRAISFKTRFDEANAKITELQTLLRTQRDNYEAQLDRMEASLEYAELERSRMIAMLKQMQNEKSNVSKEIEVLLKTLKDNKRANASNAPKQPAYIPQQPRQQANFTPKDLPSYKDVLIPENPQDVVELFKRK